MKNSVLTLLFAVAVPCAFGGTITQYTGASSNWYTGNYEGEEFTTPAGGPWDSITFNFFSAGSPSASGNLFLLSLAYLGTPAALSSSTPGFIASASASGGLWTFASNITLQANTQYWVYGDAPLTGDGDSGSSAGQQTYYSFTNTGNFTTAAAGEDNFNLSGTAVPEPGTLCTLGAGIALLGAFRLRRRSCSMSEGTLRVPLAS
jgi:hypothetical protein